MSKEKLVTPEAVNIEFDQPRIDGAMVAMQEDGKSLAFAQMEIAATVRAVAAQIGYQLPAEYADPDLIQRDIASNMRRTAEAMLQVGLGLVVLKEACRHGEFMARLEVLGFEPRVAQRYMQVARKLSNASTSTHLVKAAASQSKLLELIVLDDDQLEELELTGQTGELKLDDVASMSVKELRKRVRDLQNENQANEKLLTHKNKLIDEAALIKAAPPDEMLAELQAESTKWLNDAHGALVGKLSGSLEALASHYIEHGGESIVPFMAGMVGQLQADLNTLRDRFNIPDVTPAMIPDFVRSGFGTEE